ncbi:MAG: cation-translocating P-type ATPase [Deltaproteobacteria bacterium]|nr:MAG: cation-translocating P-type ATPase [Deltaproteobacteria bacterium]
MLPGLTTQEAQKRLFQDGKNEIIRENSKPVWKVFLHQFNSSVVYLLLGACLISFALSEWADAFAILIIIILNAVIGFVQEYKAEKAISALRSMTAPRARVIRDGHSVLLLASEVVVGDLLILESGDIIASDAQLIQAHSFLTNEAALTGESFPVEKKESDLIFMGTTVVAGSAMASVLHTGMKTELGKIAHLLSTSQDDVTPLQKQLQKLSLLLIFICLGIVTIIAGLGLLRNQHWVDVLLSSISLGVAAVPESLPAIITITLALGVQRMSRRHVLVRNLPSVETLGCVNVICTDKTGTLTTGHMVIREIWGADHDKVLYAATACNDAELGNEGRADIGDPTEIAILKEAAERSILKESIESNNPRIAVNPFDSERKRMSIQRQDHILYLKGAVDFVLPLCSRGTEGVIEANAQMAKRGLRVLAVAYGDTVEEKNLTFLGLLGIADPPRTEVIEAVQRSREAGIRTIMITGDHPITAEAIAREIGILSEAEDVLEVVHARATPEDKLKIIDYWKKRGAIVAMTGDGVNDAPALKEAHIGIAMGKSGTEVTREAADMILSDDNYASIIAGIEEGRGIYENIQKSLMYLLSGNICELLVMFGAAILGFPAPFLPLQILWINIVTDGFPALALSMEPPSKNLLKHPPRKPFQPILGRTEWKFMIIVGIFETALVLLTFSWFYFNKEIALARNMAFSVLVFAELFKSLAFRSRYEHFWKLGAFDNIFLIFIIFVFSGIQILLDDISLLQKVLPLKPLSTNEILIALALGLSPLIILECVKFFRNPFNVLKKSSL